MSPSLIQILEPLIGSTLTIGHPEAPEEIRLDHLGRPQETSIPSWTVSLFSESGTVLHPDLQRQLHPDLAIRAHEFLNNKD
ncbi:MAG: hypothetical protein IE913_06345 [Halothiobacillus sp.]|nr:hypothetical protein [Halothiobacillus sp.]